MGRVANTEMSEQRALLTETEREILSGEKDVKDNYRYSVESRVRTRLRDRFSDDVELLREDQPKMYEILMEAVDKGEELDDIAESGSSDEQQDLLSEEEAEEAKQAASDLRERDRDRLDEAKGAFENEAEESTESATSTPVEEEVQAGITDEDMVVPRLDLQGRGEKLRKRQDAVRAAFEYVQEHGEATPADLKEEIYPEYDGEYASARSWWKNCVYDAFTQLADEHGLLQKADTSGVWTYTGETDE